MNEEKEFPTIETEVVEIDTPLGVDGSTQVQGWREVFDPFPNPISNKYVLLAGPNNPTTNGVYRYIIGERLEDGKARVINEITFQHGNPMDETGINGVLSVHVVLMLIDHLNAFQQGPFSNRETAIMITKLQEVLHWIAQRASNRMFRGVHGEQKA